MPHTDNNRMVINETSNQYRIVLAESLNKMNTKLNPFLMKIDKIEKNIKINNSNQLKILKALNKINKNIETLSVNIQTLNVKQQDIEDRLLTVESKIP
uniref:Uncharacterized protein n=1 Tax=viral metagenome TaxID=1070528 RepID=A0A6C0LLJ3_9ZZZZ